MADRPFLLFRAFWTREAQSQILYVILLLLLS